MGVLLGNGMYNVPNNKERYTKFTGFFGQPKLILQLHVTYADGTSTTVLSDYFMEVNEWADTFSRPPTAGRITTLVKTLKVGISRI